jgi:hypothetical protein
MEFTLWHQLGILVGAALGYLNFRFIIGIIVPRLRALDNATTAEERGAFERKIALLRRIILVFEILALAVIGYFVGGLVGSWQGG